MATANSIGGNTPRYAVMEHPVPHSAPGGGFVCYGLVNDCEGCSQKYNYVDQWFPLHAGPYQVHSGPWTASVAGATHIQLACYKL